MPFLLRTRVKANEKIVFVLSFGDLSCLEIVCVLNNVEIIEKMCEMVAVVKTNDQPERIEKIYGIYKAGYPVVELKKFDRILDEININEQENIKFSISSYCSTNELREKAGELLKDSLARLGYKKFKILPRQELTSDEILRKKVLDFILFAEKGDAIAPTIFVSDIKEISSYSMKRPYIMPEISISPRLVSCLLNIAGVERGKVLLDPFCGSGTIIIEALRRKASVIGADSSPQRIQITKKNITSLFGVQASYSLIVSEVSQLSRRVHKKVDSIVTEPILLPSFQARPSKQRAEILLEDAKETYTEFFNVAEELIKPGGRVIVVVPEILTLDGASVSIKVEGRFNRLKPFTPKGLKPEYPIRISSQSTRFVKRNVYVFEAS